MQLGQENFINRFYGAFFKSDKQLKELLFQQNNLTRALKVTR